MCVFFFPYNFGLSSASVVQLVGTWRVIEAGYGHEGAYRVAIYRKAIFGPNSIPVRILYVL